LRYLKKDSYTLLSLTGKNFLTSAKDSYYLIERNKDRFKDLMDLGDIYINIARLSITSFTVMIMYLLLSVKIFTSIAIFNFPILPTFIVGFIAFIIGSLFVGVYGRATDSLLVTYCLDEEIDNYHNENNEIQRAPKTLVEFVGQYIDKDYVKDNKALEDNNNQDYQIQSDLK
jgi:choline transporter-like protein 2/4/5